MPSLVPARAERRSARRVAVFAALFVAAQAGCTQSETVVLPDTPVQAEEDGGSVY